MVPSCVSAQHVGVPWQATPAGEVAAPVADDRPGQLAGSAVLAECGTPDEFVAICGGLFTCGVVEVRSCSDLPAAQHVAVLQDDSEHCRVGARVGGPACWQTQVGPNRAARMRAGGGADGFRTTKSGVCERRETWRAR